MSVMPETFQSAMGPYVEMAAVGLALYAWTAVFRAAVLWRRRRRQRRWWRRCSTAHRHQRHRRVSCEGTATRVPEGKRRRIDVDRGCLPRVALVAAQAPHHLPRSVGHAELAHSGAVHVVVKGHGADAHTSVLFVSCKLGLFLANSERVRLAEPSGSISRAVALVVAVGAVYGIVEKAVVRRVCGVDIELASGRQPHVSEVKKVDLSNLRFADLVLKVLRIRFELFAFRMSHLAESIALLRRGLCDAETACDVRHVNVGARGAVVGEREEVAL
eukprot:scaffold27645_cov59-Phaeocystis_antarctica.AAC.1